MLKDDQPHLLPDELERALRAATDRTLATLTALRVAVREHVHKSRDSGNDLDEIQLQLRTIADRALVGIQLGENTDGRPGSLSRQIVRWSEGFYTERR
jgi:hypothetical protein